jgi:uncharacterized LabA/DUF88 family protein
VQNSNRVIAYIDGYNLYHGIKERGWNRFLWLDVRMLVCQLLKPYQALVHTKYFTARSTGRQDSRKRQALYLDAIQTLPDTSLHFGKFKNLDRECPHCGFKDTVPVEKMTDVNISIQLLGDAFENRFDSALLISGDSDLVPVVKAVRELDSAKRIIVAFPPGRHSKELQKCATGAFMIGRDRFLKSQLPNPATAGSGAVIVRPSEWT